MDSPPNDQDPQVVTFGCRLNTYESEVMRTHARNAGLKDVIIFNTCAVTKEAERQARQAIRKAGRENPGATIIVTGCSAQIDPQTYARMPEVSQVLGNDLKLKAESWSVAGPETHGQASAVNEAPKPEGFLIESDVSEKILVNDIMSVTETAEHLVEGFEGRARAYVQVQNGCDHRCTFCIIPYGRGNSRSVPIGVIADQVRQLTAKGYREIVFTGVDITSYGADLPGRPTLGQMIRRVLALTPDLPRLRLSSIDPVEIDEDMWRMIAEEPRFMPHLHLSLQAGDDMILKRMKRRHLRQDVIDVCARARSLRPDIVFGADIIAGFPTETDVMFENSLRIVDECDLTWLHVFPYSQRPGTPAARMPQVPGDVRKARAALLREKGECQVEKFLNQNINKTMQVLVEKENMGRTEHFAPVLLDDAVLAGDLVTARIEAAAGGNLIGRVLRKAVSASPAQAGLAAHTAR